MDKSIIDQINEKTDIVELVSEFIELTKKGKNYFGLCPFHDEKTPSFSVSTEKNIAFCMGCKEGGNPVNFYKKVKNIPFNQAVDELATRLGLTIEKKNVKTDPNEPYYQLMHEVSKFYQFNLKNSEKGQNALKYLYQRQMTDEIIELFQIGYAPPFGDDVYRFLRDHGYQTTDMLKLGIIKQDDQGKYYDLFSDRVMFTIKNELGKVVGFSGRTIHAQEQVKYINSPETEIFKKGQLLYHFDQALKEVRKQKNIVLYEGFFDVISSTIAHIKQGVATMGTALTRDQAKLIKKSTDTVIICYDGDQAGQKATYQAIGILEKEQLKVSVLNIPEGLDPDEFVKSYGPEAFENLFGEYVIDPFQFKYEFYKKQSNLSHAHDIKIFKENIIQMLKYADPSIQNIYKEKLYKDLNLEIDGALLKVPHKEKLAPIKLKDLLHSKLAKRHLRADRNLAIHMLRSKQAALEISQELHKEFAELPTKLIRDYILNYYLDHETLIIEDFLDTLKKEHRDHIEQVIFSEFIYVTQAEMAPSEISEYIEHVKEAHVIRRMEYLKLKINQSEENHQIDIDEFSELIIKYKKIK